MPGRGEDRARIKNGAQPKSSTPEASGSRGGTLKTLTKSSKAQPQSLNPKP